MPRRIYMVCMLLLATGLLFAGCEQSTQGPEIRRAKDVKPYVAKDFSQLKGMEGFSDALLENHFKLYKGYVKNTNMLLDRLGTLLNSGKAGSLEYSELKRRLGFELDGMKLHELYFLNLGGKQAPDPQQIFFDAIVKNFGSFELWKKDFEATGLMRGVGWVVLYYDPESGRLANFWINDHEINHAVGCKPLLVMDVWEHAYMPDYQLDRGKYIDAFFNNVDWNEVAARYDEAVGAALIPPQGRMEPLGMPTTDSLKMFEQGHETKQ